LWEDIPNALSLEDCVPGLDLLSILLFRETGARCQFLYIARPLSRGRLTPGFRSWENVHVGGQVP
jgi:hypothetical protein